MRTTTVLAAALTAAAALTLSACGGGDDGQPVVSSSASASATKAATVLDQPFNKPDLVLTGTDGKKYDLVERTRGRPTLLYFGYTNCPDVCPLTVSNIAIARKGLTKAEQDKLQVVFVTSDPERDTPKRLGEWLRGAGHPSFVGLTGEFDAIQAGARSVGIGLAKPRKQKDGSIVSTHGAQVLAFSPKDDKAHLLYGEGTTAEDYAQDLPEIIKGEAP